jgi:hypothetical protein
MEMNKKYALRFCSVFNNFMFKIEQYISAPDNRDQKNSTFENHFVYGFFSSDIYPV